VTGDSYDLDAHLAAVLAGASERIREDLSRARAMGFVDAHGHIITDRWPDDMQPDASTSVETG
jgi:hypothetical protein